MNHVTLCTLINEHVPKVLPNVFYFSTKNANTKSVMSTTTRATHERLIVEVEVFRQSKWYHQDR
jgi:hypothetical protein